MEILDLVLKLGGLGTAGILLYLLLDERKHARYLSDKIIEISTAQVQAIAGLSSSVRNVELGIKNANTIVRGMEKTLILFDKNENTEKVDKNGD